MSQVERFRDRGSEPTRVEAFSDAVFGFALTLLVVALEVPRDFGELWSMMSGFLAFAASFAILAWIWWEHHVFFRRFGLSDGVTVVLNFLLLFVVLFYVYPLKFVFTMLSAIYVGGGTAGPASGRPMLLASEAPTLMAVYAGGFIAVFSIFAMMHWRALALRHALELTPFEAACTRVYLRSHVLATGVGVISFAIALLVPMPHGPGLSGFTYGLLGPVLGFHGWWSSRQLSEDATARGAA
jgi:uncharacterized membrane protein